LKKKLLFIMHYSRGGPTNMGIYIVTQINQCFILRVPK